MMKMCVVYEMKFGPNRFTKAKGISIQRHLALVPTWSGHATCGKFFQSIIGEETTKKVTYMRIEHKILCKIM
jgi:hypothetical protein